MFVNREREGKKIEDLSIGICGNNSQFNMRLPHSLLMPGLPGEEVGYSHFQEQGLEDEKDMGRRV